MTAKAKIGMGRLLVWGLALAGFSLSGWALWRVGNLSPELLAGALNGRLLVVVLLALAGVAFRGVRLKIMASAAKETIGFRDGVRIALIGDMASGLSPGRVAGEPARWNAIWRLGIPPGHVGVILGGEFAADLLTIFCIVPAVLLLSHYVSASSASHTAWLSMLGLGAGPLLIFFAVGYAAIVHLARLTDVAVGLFNRLPVSTPVLGKRKAALAGSLKHTAQDFYSRFFELMRFGKRRWACACLMGVGHALTRLALLPAVAWALGFPIALAPLLLWECAVYYGLAFVPLPGGGGTAETASLLYLNGYLSPESASLLLIFWRFFDYYLLVGLGSLALLLKRQSGLPLSSLLSAKPAE